MKWAHILILVTAMLATTSADARIGETLEELEARFGKGRNVTLGSIGFRPPITAKWQFEKNGIKITASFVGEKCGYLYYKASPGSNAPQIFPPESIAQLLKANGVGNSWKADETPTNAFNRVGVRGSVRASWRRTDGSVYAMYSGYQVSFVSEEFIRAIESVQEDAAAKIEEDDKNRFDGF